MPDINAYLPRPCSKGVECVPGFVGTGFNSDTTGHDPHESDVPLGFTGSGGFNGCWMSFNSQPDLPNDGIVVDIGSNGVGDPNMLLAVTEDAVLLAFRTPDPATIALLGVGPFACKKQEASPPLVGGGDFYISGLPGFIQGGSAAAKPVDNSHRCGAAGRPAGWRPPRLNACLSG